MSLHAPVAKRRRRWNCDRGSPGSGRRPPPDPPRLSWRGDGPLTGWCDCPYGQGGNFCKHCVAVGLAALGQAESVPRQRASATGGTRVLAAWLASRTREELLALLQEHLAEDRDLRRRLELRAASTGGGHRHRPRTDPEPARHPPLRPLRLRRVRRRRSLRAAGRRGSDRLARADGEPPLRRCTPPFDGLAIVRR
ncbi:SWIM zinc finger family protein [Streptomyces sp. NBC_00555]|uniref:SWIM zinc finger family protein n=1 Tax=Streptomyces sp. NBC_00555 TaxID=2903662 RepID=UPI00224FBC1C|nr:SWIM zinc finger family protein [Streptomyces sp. NBC_00555]MCX5010466.1 SWIM zinc finger family protein [Streptomyces sp. NBC_00555]